MKVSIDPFMVRDRGFSGICRFAAEHNYKHIELSIREDFIPLFVAPRAGEAAVKALKDALVSNGIGLANMWTVYRWSEPASDHAHDARDPVF
jgi:myo-inositol catabolism protein IolH